MIYTLYINERTYAVDCDPDRTLLDVLREDLRLTGTKRGCDIGVCGTCTVIIDGETKRACKVKVKDVAIGEDHSAPSLDQSRVTSHESRITTIEGLEKDGRLHPIQQAFIDCGAVQCGFCTPGMVLAAKALLDKNPSPTRDDIKKALSVNLCRCTGYQQIFEAVEQAARAIRV